MATYTERLQKVRDAIDAILTDGQAIVTMDGRQWRAADLAQLQGLEARYEGLACREQRGSLLDNARAAIPHHSRSLR